MSCFISFCVVLQPRKQNVWFWIRGSFVCDIIFRWRVYIPGLIETCVLSMGKRTWATLQGGGKTRAYRLTDSTSSLTFFQKNVVLSTFFKIKLMKIHSFIFHFHYIKKTWMAGGEVLDGIILNFRKLLPIFGWMEIINSYCNRWFWKPLDDIRGPPRPGPRGQNVCAVGRGPLRASKRKELQKNIYHPSSYRPNAFQQWRLFRNFSFPPKLI